MARLFLPSQEAMTNEQRGVCDEVIAGSRGKIPSPMVAWIQNPDLAQQAQKLGEVLRFHTVLARDLTELAILICARHWRAHQVWTSHLRYARQFGVSETVLTALATGGKPAFERETEEVVFSVCTNLLEEKRLEVPLYERFVTMFGERALVELVALVGYYCLTSLTANAFELGLPDNTVAAFVELDLEKG